MLRAHLNVVTIACNDLGNLRQETRTVQAINCEIEGLHAAHSHEALHISNSQDFSKLNTSSMAEDYSRIRQESVQQDTAFAAPEYAA